MAPVYRDACSALPPKPRMTLHFPTLPSAFATCCAACCCAMGAEMTHSSCGTRMDVVRMPEMFVCTRFHEERVTDQGIDEHQKYHSQPIKHTISADSAAD